MFAWVLLASPILGSSMAPICHGFGGIGDGCAAAKPGDSGKSSGISLGDTTLAVKVSVACLSGDLVWLMEKMLRMHNVV